MQRIPLALLALLVSGPYTTRPRVARAIPVFDAGNLAQNVITALENMEQTVAAAKNVELQIQAVDEMVRNGMAVPVYVWDKLDSIGRNLATMDETLNRYFDDIRNVDEALAKFGDLDYYRSAECYGGNLDCPPAVWERVLEAERERRLLASVAIKSASDAALRTTEGSQSTLAQDTLNLSRIQRQAADVREKGGQLAALQAANELASAQAKQLMEMRTLMIAMYKAMALEMEDRNTEKAQQEAADERFWAPPPKTGNNPTRRLVTWPDR